MRDISTEALLTLGMALYADKKTMEQRVRGIFARRRSSVPALAALAALIPVLGILFFTTACVPVREIAEDLRTGLGTVSLASLGHAEVAFEYAGELSPAAGTPARDETVTIAPKLAALAACNMARDAFGAEAVNGQEAAVQYAADGAPPYYEVTLAPSSVVTRVDAVSGMATFSYIEQIADTGAPLPADDPAFAEIEAACRQAAEEYLSVRYGEGYFSGDSRLVRAYPCADGEYDFCCVYLLSTGGERDYEMTYLYDAEAASVRLIAQEVVSVSQDGSVTPYAALCADMPFTRARIQAIYRALCGDKTPLQYTETRQELNDYLRRAGGTISAEEEQRIRALLPDAPKTHPVAEIDLIYASGDPVEVEQAGGNASFLVLNSGERNGVVYTAPAQKNGAALSRDAALAAGKTLLGAEETVALTAAEASSDGTEWTLHYQKADGAADSIRIVLGADGVHGFEWLVPRGG